METSPNEEVPHDAGKGHAACQPRSGSPQNSDSSDERRVLTSPMSAMTRSSLARLTAIEQQVLAVPDQQILLTDPDSRSRATSGRGSALLATTCRRRSILSIT